MVPTRFALILYFRMVAHKAACHTLSKAFLKSMKTWYRFCWYCRFFSHRILRLKICSVVLLPALNPAYSSAVISSAWGLSLCKMTFNMTLLDFDSLYMLNQRIRLSYQPNAYNREIISIFHGCMVWIEKSVTTVTDRHHEACRVMPNSDRE